MAAQQENTTYIALFHTADLASAAIRDLEQLGVPRSSVTVLNREGRDTNSADRLSTLGVPDRDRKHLEDGIAHGGTVVSLEASEAQSGEIEKIFDRYSTDKIDEADLDRKGFEAPLAAAAEVPVAAAAVIPAAATEVESGVISLAAEELVVGKREVDRGGVRVHRRVVSEPVSQSVNLHDERVVVERHAINRPVTDADLQQGDVDIELTGTREEAVITKTARVVEEVVIGKQASDRTETVHGNVRHTEVEIEEIPAVDTTTPSTKF